MKASFSHIDHLFPIIVSICSFGLFFVHSAALTPRGTTVLPKVGAGGDIFSLKPFEASEVSSSWPFPPSKDVPLVFLSGLVSSSRPRVRLPCRRAWLYCW